MNTVQTTTAAEQALRELYDLLMEYDLEIVIEESGQELDTIRGNTGNQEWARVLGIFADVKAALGIESELS
jgi:hypothetical protein